MKIALLILTAAALSAGPLTHPNQLAALPAPVIPLSAALDLGELQAQNPQYTVSYLSHGLVGLFGLEWRAPVWTTPKLDDFKEWPNDEGFAWIQPVIPPVVLPPVVVHPPNHCHDCRPVEAPPVIDQIPEPMTWILVGVGLMAICLRRKR